MSSKEALRESFRRVPETCPAVDEAQVILHKRLCVLFGVQLVGFESQSIDDRISIFTSTVKKRATVPLREALTESIESRKHEDTRYLSEVCERLRKVARELDNPLLGTSGGRLGDTVAMIRCDLQTRFKV